MKKLFTVFLILSAIVLSSCGKGASISYMNIKNTNEPQALLLRDGVAAYKETLTYFDAEGNKEYSYSVYIEPNADGFKPFNVHENHGDVQLYAVDGEIYSVENGKIYSILQAFGTYYDFTEKYSTGYIPFDNGLFYQLYSETEKESITVAYFSEILPATVAKYSAMGIKLGDTVKVVYELDLNSVANKITYFIRDGGNEAKERKILCRQFEYFGEKQCEFKGVPTLENTVKVMIEYSADHIQTFNVPVGTYIGIDTAGKDVAFYSDAERTVPFDFSSAEAFDGMKIYAAEN